MPLGREGNGWYTQDQTLAAWEWEQRSKQRDRVGQKPGGGNESGLPKGLQGGWLE